MCNFREFRRLRKGERWLLESIKDKKESLWRGTY
jgi:hypothetical protein